MDIYHTIIRPLVTEKSSHQAKQGEGTTRGGSYAFEVHHEATKAQIRDAVEKIYNVKVVDVRTMNRPGKVRRFKFRYGASARAKKAVVELHHDSHIDLF
ncbi:50S ribosomal protein L23 [Phycisphaerae bacterium RAS1]|nr:50S ribosomal protein L23 [Phycisphaerae bacterium RAS1]